MNAIPSAVPRHERLIAALDVPTAAEARALAEKLGDSVRFYKIGLELSTSGGYFELLDWLDARAIPRAVATSTRRARARSATKRLKRRAVSGLSGSSLA